MDIQKILFPEVGRCTETELYFRLGKKTEYRGDKKSITFRKHAVVTFDTYFNGFSIEKWMKYTVLQELALRLSLSGKFKVTLLGKDQIHNDVLTKVISETVVECDGRGEFEFPYTLGEKKGMYTFRLEALSDGGCFYGGTYITDLAKERVRDVKLGIAICTFKREAFVEKNIRILNEEILNNPASPLYGRMKVFIADNGKSLDRERLSSEHICINPNRNLGGAGGFTRDLIEMMNHNEELGITRAVNG